MAAAGSEIGRLQQQEGGVLREPGMSEERVREEARAAVHKELHRRELGRLIPAKAARLTTSAESEIREAILRTIKVRPYAGGERRVPGTGDGAAEGWARALQALG